MAGGLGGVLLVVEVWHPVPVTDQELRRRKHSFGYDMGVSVLANLVAAAVIYLGASTADTS
jgi:hypothetical protein